MSDPRYASGTSLNPTQKEHKLEQLDGLLEIDEPAVWNDLKNLKLATLSYLLNRVSAAIGDAEVRGVRHGRGEDLTKPRGQWQSKKAEPKPIDMVLFCPKCNAIHIDRPEPEKGWDNPPHRSHLCHGCGTIWRPADVPTNGVAKPQTRGEKDTFVYPS